MGKYNGFRTYLVWMVGGFAFVCLSTAAVNLTIDPYGVFGMPRIQGFTEIKPASLDRARTAKAYGMLRSNPKTLIGGNSRPDVGLDPRSGCWSETEQPVYNLSLPGDSIYTVTRYLQEAIARGNVQSVFLGLDYKAFLTRPSDDVGEWSWPPEPTERERKLSLGADGRPNPDYWKERSTDWLSSLFSLGALSDSIITVLRQGQADAPNRRADGFNPGGFYRKIRKTEGQAALFDQKLPEVRSWLAVRGGIFEGDSRWSRRWETLRQFLRFAREQGVQVTLFIDPLHTLYLQEIAAAGKWDEIETWKIGLVELAQAEKLPGVWDFQDFDYWSSEPPPAAGDTVTELRWFWEPAHYRSMLGERMLASMLGRDCVSTDEGEPANYGVLLTKDSLDQVLQQKRRRMLTHMADRRAATRNP